MLETIIIFFQINLLTYFIKCFCIFRPKEGTPPDLVAIDFNTGQITVQKSQAIDADEPPRFYLHYKVTATDKCSLDDESQCPEDKTYWNTVGDVSLQSI